MSPTSNIDQITALGRTIDRRVNERLDRLERSLPAIPSRTVALARASADRTASVATTVASRLLGATCASTAALRTAGATTVGQARSAAGRAAASAADRADGVVGRARDAAKATIDETVERAEGVADDVRTAATRTRADVGARAREVGGQLRAQGRIAAETVEGETLEALDAGIVAVGADASRLREMSRAELYELAKAADVPGRSSMNKSELVAALAA